MVKYSPNAETARKLRYPMPKGTVYKGEIVYSHVIAIVPNNFSCNNGFGYTSYKTGTHYVNFKQ